MVENAELPEKWQKEHKAVRAIQMAFDISDRGQYLIRKEALDKNITPSDRIRQILSLHMISTPKRPRLSISLKDEDFIVLAKRYNVDTAERKTIKQMATEELLEYINNKLA